MAECGSTSSTEVDASTARCAGAGGSSGRREEGCRVAENACPACGCAFAECECSDREPKRKIKGKLSPYQRIVRAAKRGTGVRLSPDECWQMHLDDAIATVAWRDEEDDQGDR